MVRSIIFLYYFLFSIALLFSEDIWRCDRSSTLYHCKKESRTCTCVGACPRGSPVSIYPSLTDLYSYIAG